MRSRGPTSRARHRRSSMRRRGPTCWLWPRSRWIAAAAARLSAQSAYFNSLLRTTCVATRLDGGHAPNALPQLATANVNCRILPGVPVNAVVTELTKVLADPAIQISLVAEATPSKPAVLREDVMTATETIVKSMFPGVPVVPGDEHRRNRRSLSSQRRHPDVWRGRSLRRHRRRPRARPRRARRCQTVLSRTWSSSTG